MCTRTHTSPIWPILVTASSQAEQKTSQLLWLPSCWNQPTVLSKFSDHLRSCSCLHPVKNVMEASPVHSQKQVLKQPESCSFPFLFSNPLGSIFFNLMAGSQCSLRFCGQIPSKWPPLVWGEREGWPWGYVYSSRRVCYLKSESLIWADVFCRELYLQCNCVKKWTLKKGLGSWALCPHE